MSGMWSPGAFSVSAKVMPVDSGENVGGASRAFALQALVALHAAVGGVAGFAFLEGDLDAVDAAVARIDQLE